MKGTPLDFTHPKRIETGITSIKGSPGGYDHNYDLGETGQRKHHCCPERKVLFLYPTK